METTKHRNLSIPKKETTSLDFLKAFPYREPRKVQTEILQSLQDNWNNYDVFMIVAPTASGKTAIAKSVMNAAHRVSYIAPTNLLVDQFLQEFPDTRTLARMDSYMCEEWRRPCSQTRARLMAFCQGCKCSADLQQAKYRRGPGAYNFYTYMAHKLYRDVLIVDEAHTLIGTIKDRLALRIWKHDYKYPDNMYSPEQILNWIGTLSPKKQKDKKIVKLKEAVTYKVPEYIAERTKDWFNGKGTLRGEAEERDCIKLLPVDITQAPPMFWPQEVKKIVLLSGTISRKDLEQLGLSRKRILKIEGRSPIPIENRPVIIEPVTSVSRNNMDTAVPELAEYIQYVADQFPNKKGVVHATYQLASLLREKLSGPRYIFHDRSNKKDKYLEFRNAPAVSGKILIASGMYEGIDLPEDLGRWQIIAKVPWQSLANPAIRHLAELDPELFNWETIKTLVQAAGRISRTPTDYGITLIPDTTFFRLIKECKPLFPQYFLEALQFTE